MFKKAEAAWNARTPVWLHNRTKENIIFQLTGVALFLGVVIARDEWERRREQKALKSDDPTEA